MVFTLFTLFASVYIVVYIVDYKVNDICAKTCGVGADAAIETPRAAPSAWECTVPALGPPSAWECTAQARLSGVAQKSASAAGQVAGRAGRDPVPSRALPFQLMNPVTRRGAASSQPSGSIQRDGQMYVTVGDIQRDLESAGAGPGDTISALIRENNVVMREVAVAGYSGGTTCLMLLV